MNTNRYEVLLSEYKTLRNKKLLVMAGVMVLGYLLAASGIGALVGLVAMICLMMEAARCVSLSAGRKQSMSRLQQRNQFYDALNQLEDAAKITADGRTYHVSEDYLYLQHGAVYAISDIQWIYPRSRAIAFFSIPCFRLNWCMMRLSDGTEAVVFNGQTKNQEEFSALLTRLYQINPDLLIGYTPANEEAYKNRIRSAS